MESFHFKGFTPCDALRIKAERALDRIIERAPSDSRITAAVEKVDELYHCNIEIGSSICPFVVETSHKFPAIAVDKAELNLMRRLDKWRGTRFIFDENMPTRAPLRVAT